MLSLLTSATPALHATLLAAAKTTKKTTGSSITLFIIILVFFGVYFLWLRPQRQRMRQQQVAQQASIDVGEEIVTTSGIVGRIVAFNGDRVELEIAEGTTIEIIRSAIGRRATPAVPDEVEDDGEDYGDGAHRYGDHDPSEFDLHEDADEYGLHHDGAPDDESADDEAEGPADATGTPLDSTRGVDGQPPGGRP